MSAGFLRFRALAERSNEEANMSNQGGASRSPHTYRPHLVIAMILLSGLVAIVASPAGGVVMIGLVRAAGSVLSVLKAGDQHGDLR
jgi:hypothetical protein